jgi:glutathione S-transferase
MANRASKPSGSALLASEILWKALSICDSFKFQDRVVCNGMALPGPVDYVQIPELAKRGLARLQHFFVTLNDRLADREFVVTDRFSIADITAVVAVDFARVVKVKPDERHPHLQHWRVAMANRESISI